jgi:hypothetical protein
MASISSASLAPGAGLRDTWERLRDSRARARSRSPWRSSAVALVWGALVAYAAVGATLLALSFIACLLCLRDFRVGVALLIMIMPISSSTLFPHAMFGMTGMNPLNLLLVATLAVFIMRAAGTEASHGIVPRQLLWLYVAPIVAAAVIGAQHVSEIPRIFKASDMLEFDNAFGYLRDILVKPMGLVVYAVLVGAAVAWSQRPEKFVIPMLVPSS